MRLLNSDTLQFRDCFGEEKPKYAILSHRWDCVETSYEAFDGRNSSDTSGTGKIRDFCKFAKARSFKWVWVDTCCIDKRSSAELSEAINSMYQWYQEASVCIAYLADVPGGAEKEQLRALSKSEWFQRGWTLQELLAPSEVIFCNKTWDVIGTKRTLVNALAEYTKIPAEFLNNTHRPQEASVAMRMSWISNRRTTKDEDMAYCLLGLFDVNMPPLYGERKRAFYRLQLQIIKHSDDESIFAWRSSHHDWGMLAPSPRAFKDSFNIINIPLHPEERMPYVMTNRGLQIRSASDTAASNQIDVSTNEPLGYPDHVLELGCFDDGGQILTSEDSNAESAWESNTLAVQLRRRGTVWWRTTCWRFEIADNHGRRRRRNRSYDGRGVQRIYIVHQPA